MQHKKSMVVILNMCNKMTSSMLFNSGIDYSHPNINIMFHVTFIMKHAETIVATTIT
jgi:hypothetical protein